MTRILEGVKVGDQVIVVSSNIGPDGLRRTVRNIERVTKVFTHVLRTDSMSGVEIATGRTPWTYGGKAVAPASDADVADVLREIEERKHADAEYMAKLAAELAADKRYGELRGEISRLMSMRVPEDVLIRALAVLRGEEGGV